MSDHNFRRQGQQGQMVALFALSLIAMLLAVGLVVDGGYAFAQQRESQNAADFGALAGARVVALAVDANNNGQVPPNDAAVQAAIQNAVSANGGAVAFGAPNGPQYVDDNGALLGYVGAGGTIPSDALGVRVGASRSWTPFFLGLIGVSSWTASGSATARGGYLAGAPGGSVLPIGVSVCNFPNPPASAHCTGTPPTTYDFCPSNETAQQCGSQDLTDGGLNLPGGFGWLKFGCYPGNNAVDDKQGCSNNTPFLQHEIGDNGPQGNEPPGHSYGCCGNIPPGSVIDIGSLPGNKPADLSYYVNNNVTVLVPVYRDCVAGQSGCAQGSGGYYEVIGFVGMQITSADTHAKWLTGVWRQPFFTGPTTTSPGFPGAPLAIQLVR